MLRKDYGNNNDNNNETITIVINLFFGKKCLKKRLPDDELQYWKK